MSQVIQRKPRTVKNTRVSHIGAYIGGGYFGAWRNQRLYYPDDGVTGGETKTEVKTEVKAETGTDHKAEIDTLKTQIADLTKKIDGVNLAKNRIEAKAEKKAEKDPEDATLTARVKAAETREANVRKREQFNAIHSALLGNGIHKEKASRFAKLVMMEEADKIEMDETDPLQPRVLYKESEDKKTPLNEWIKAYLESDKGNWMKPDRATATSPGLDKQSNTNQMAAGFAPKTKAEARKNPDVFYAWTQTEEGKAKYNVLPEK